MSSLQQQVTTLEDEGYLQEVESGLYACKCTTRLLKKSSLRRHFKSAKHREYIVPENRECGICYDRKKDFWTCPKCKNDHCVQCHDHIRNGKCPFCRHQYQNRPETPRLPFLEPLPLYEIPNAPTLGAMVEFLFPEPPVLERQQGEYYDNDLIDILATQELLNYLHNNLQ